MTVLRVAAAQVSTGPDPVANLATATAAVRQAAAGGAELVVLPEATLACFGTDLSSVAEPLDGPFATGLRKVAADLEVVVAAGLFEPSSDGRVHNTRARHGARRRSVVPEDPSVRRLRLARVGHRCSGQGAGDVRGGGT